MTLRNEMENLHNIHEKGNVNLMNKNLDLRLNFAPLSYRSPVIFPEQLNQLLIFALILFILCFFLLSLIFFSSLLRVLHIHILTFIPFRSCKAWSCCLLFLSVVHFFFCKFLFHLIRFLFITSLSFTPRIYTVLLVVLFFFYSMPWLFFYLSNFLSILFLFEKREAL